MLPLTVSFETVLQIFNNSFKQEDVKVGLFPNMRKDDFVHSRLSRSRKRFCIFVCALCVISLAFAIACALSCTCHVSTFLVSYTNGL